MKNQKNITKIQSHAFSICHICRQFFYLLFLLSNWLLTPAENVLCTATKPYDTESGTIILCSLLGSRLAISAYWMCRLRQNISIILLFFCIPPAFGRYKMENTAHGFRVAHRNRSKWNADHTAGKSTLRCCCCCFFLFNAARSPNCLAVRFVHVDVAKCAVSEVPSANIEWHASSEMWPRIHDLPVVWLSRPAPASHQSTHY